MSWLMVDIAHGKIGLIADSHSKNSLMLTAIHTLRAMGASTFIHLGDICDSLMPENLDEAVEILNRYKVKAILGNNEYMLISEYLLNHADGLKEATISFLKELPYTIVAGEICFTHSLPFDWPAATRRPIKEYLPVLMESNRPHPHRIIFRGHSHSPSVIEIEDGCMEELTLDPGEKITLYKERIYVITVGAVENGACALFDPASYEFCPVSLTSK
ncbi:MAG: metallophosphoesterase family protein [Thermodesulfobacteriota bacterium]|nr:metallophosphoesterase family protein [Thermodesulfobacteriota bacterium]